MQITPRLTPAPSPQGPPAEGRPPADDRDGLALGRPATATDQVAWQALRVSLAPAAEGPDETDPVAQPVPAPPEPPSAAELAAAILADPAITLSTTMPSGQPPEGADAHSNIVDTAAGRPATRSHYGTAPGGTVALDPRMLAGIVALQKQGPYTLEISTIAGGQHAKRSLHYAGTAFDITHVNGVEIAEDDGIHETIMAALRQLGAIEVLGPGASGHDHHVHAAWSRPAADGGGSDDAPDPADDWLLA